MIVENLKGILPLETVSQLDMSIQEYKIVLKPTYQQNVKTDTQIAS